MPKSQIRASSNQPLIVESIAVVVKKFFILRLALHGFDVIGNFRQAGCAHVRVPPIGIGSFFELASGLSRSQDVVTAVAPHFSSSFFFLLYRYGGFPPFRATQRVQQGIRLIHHRLSLQE
jgi:hypothetical protein